MNKFFLLFAILLITSSFIFAQKDFNNSVLLVKLDSVVRNKKYYTEVKEKRIRQLKVLLTMTSDKEQTYNILSKIFDEYRAFSMDSSEVYAQWKFRIAKTLGKRKYIDDATMNLAEVYGTEGMYKEALDLLNSINKENLFSYLHPYYFHLYRTIYGLMSDYSLTKVDRASYTHLKNIYCDSLLSVNKKGTYLYALIRSDGLINQGKSIQAIRLLQGWIGNNKNNDDIIRTMSYTLAQAYRKTGDKNKAEYFLTLSAISDLKQASKEYASLLELSKILFSNGDLDRAYVYLKCSMEDATYCNARLRTIEVSQIFPIVEQSYQQKLMEKEHQRFIAMIGAIFVSMILSVVLFFLYKQMSRLTAARKDLQKMAEGLDQLNKEQVKLNKALLASNADLKESNISLLEANHIKEGCISNYMGLCSLYIEKMNEYRHSLIKISTNEGVQELCKKLKSTLFIENELKDFYLHFDKTFLTLFPSFVEDFNQLLVEEGRIYPKVEGQLNTELRIFALIRLGITDSTKIADFLRYSVTTIYNYRVKVRNSSFVDRNQLENRVMDIGKISVE